MFAFRRTQPLALAISVLAATSVQAASMKSAVYWNPAESGWGLFVTDQGSALAPFWYTHDSDGEPVWFSAVTLPQADGSYAGDIYRYNGVPLAQIAGQASDPAQKIGEARLGFDGETGASFQYTVGGQSVTKSLSRFNYSGKDVLCTSGSGGRAAATNYSDIWWNPTQSGWGLHINHVDNDLYAMWYTYDTDREAVFYQGVTSRQADGSYSGKLYRSQNGTPFSQINGAPASPGVSEVGTLNLRFSDGEHASFNYTIGGVSQTRNVERLVYGDTTSQCSVRAYPSNAGGGGGGTPGSDECYPPLAVGDRYRIRSTPGGGQPGETDVEVIGTGTFDGHPVFKVRYLPVGQNTDAQVIEYIEQTDSERIHYGSEGWIPEVQAQGTTRFDPPVRVPRSTPVGAQGHLVYTAVSTYTASGVGVTSEIDFDETWQRTGTETRTSPAGTFSGACRFETTLKSDVTVSVMGVSTRVQVDAMATQWSHPAIGAVRTEAQSSSIATITGSPFPVPPTTTNSTDVSEIVSAHIGGVDYP